MNKIKDMTKYITAFEEYYKEHGAWGSLHIALDDGNIEDSNIHFCIRTALEQKEVDIVGAALGYLLLAMSKTQRGKLHRMVYERAK